MLPPEILQQILLELDEKSVHSVAQACWQTNTIIDNLFWKLWNEKQPKKPPQKPNLAAKYSLKSVYLSGLRGI